MHHPSVTIVFLVFNRKKELRESLQRMLSESDYAGEVDAIVVDNASTDGSAEMVRDEFPQVRLIERAENVGVSGWNDGFAVAEGEWVLALDDDCYLPPDGLRRSVEAAAEYGADLVSYSVASTHDPDYRFTEKYRTGLFMFWGCAVLIRRSALQELVGYDPEIFVWANELEFMIRFYDRGYRHLHFPEVVAQHMKKPPEKLPYDQIDWRPYRINGRHWGYIAAKLLQPRDAAEALIALVAHELRDTFREHRSAITAVPGTLTGFAHGLRHREPVRKPALSRFYRRNFETFASPWWLMRPVRELIRSLPREIAEGRFHHDRAPKGLGRRDEYYAERAQLYPEDEPAVLDFA
ncbi:MAG TPA: glycosyltransferase [Thermoleophilaceae bacterium]